MERFERFRFSVPTVPLGEGFLGTSVESQQKGMVLVRFRFLKNGSGGSVSSSVPGKAVPMVPVSGSGSVPGPSCNTSIERLETILVTFVRLVRVLHGCRQLVS